VAATIGLLFETFHIAMTLRRITMRHRRGRVRAAWFLAIPTAAALLVGLAAVPARADLRVAVGSWPIGKSGKDADRPQLAACLDYL
jgi:hypothetical protein